MKELPVQLRTREHVHTQALFPTQVSAQQRPPLAYIPHGTTTTSYLPKSYSRAANRSSEVSLPGATPAISLGTRAARDLSAGHQSAAVGRHANAAAQRPYPNADPLLLPVCRLRTQKPFRR